ncbi:MAG: hypothetical protein OXF93_14435 [Acidobacteria bacterium]|nr:hypothetical protein [Acidobacteriota bacterium]
MLGLAAAEVSFAKASELLAALAGVFVETRQVERCADRLGREVAADERAYHGSSEPPRRMEGREAVAAARPFTACSGSVVDVGCRAARQTLADRPYRVCVLDDME